MRGFICSALLLGLLSSAVSYAETVVSKECEVSILQRGGGVDPFPIRSALPLPWSQLEGSWQAIRNNDIQVQIRILRATHSGNRFVSIKYADPISGKIYAQGVGLVRPYDRVIEAYIRGEQMSARVRLASVLPDPELRACRNKPIFVMYMTKDIDAQQTFTSVLAMKKIAVKDQLIGSSN